MVRVQVRSQHHFKTAKMAAVEIFLCNRDIFAFGRARSGRLREETALAAPEHVILPLQKPFYIRFQSIIIMQRHVFPEFVHTAYRIETVSLPEKRVLPAFHDFLEDGSLRFVGLGIQFKEPA